MKSIVALAAVALLFGVSSYAWPQELPKTPEEAINKLKEVLDVPALKNLTDTLKGLNPNETIKNLLEPVSKAEDILRKKCEKNGGNYDAAKKAGVDLFQCTHGLVNVTLLKEEMAKARPTGDLDEVFKKYCQKKPILTKCLDDFAAAVEPCLEPVEKENKRIVQNITEKILNFVCFKEGDRIALFVAAKGPECFQSQAMNITECVKNTYGSEYSKDVPFNPAGGLSAITSRLSEIKDLPPLVFDEKACRSMKSLQSCSVEKLEGCEDPTPANLLDSIFNYIRKVTPCEKLLKD